MKIKNLHEIMSTAKVSYISSRELIKVDCINDLVIINFKLYILEKVQLKIAKGIQEISK